jgi:hypothetical protein
MRLGHRLGRTLDEAKSERFTRAEVKASPDMRIHRCLYEKNNIRSRARCILVPTAS